MDKGLLLVLNASHSLKSVLFKHFFFDYLVKYHVIYAPFKLYMAPKVAVLLSDIFHRLSAIE